MNPPSAYRWLFKAIAVALIVPVPVGLMAFAITDASGPPGSAVVLVIFIVPPLWLMVLVFVGRAAAEAGLAEEAKGELEQLLRKKHLGVLSAQPHQAWHQSSYASSAALPPEVGENGPVLDQLLAWKRRTCPACNTQETP